MLPTPSSSAWAAGQIARVPGADLVLLGVAAPFFTADWTRCRQKLSANIGLGFRVSTCRAQPKLLSSLVEPSSILCGMHVALTPRPPLLLLDELCLCLLLRQRLPGSCL